MIFNFDLPSRSKCRYLWTLGDYASIANNYESNNFYRDLFIKSIRRLDLDSIYYTSLIHLNRENEICKHKRKIEYLKEANILPYRLELNKFAIEILKIEPNHEMSKAYDVIQKLNHSKSINYFWENICKNTNVAVVGNAPSFQYNGHLINDADLVLRFNNFSIKGYEQFVGTKTDAWCRICDLKCSNELILKNSLKHTILTDNPLNIPVGPEFLNEILSKDKEFYIIPQDLVSKLSQQLKAIPSSGARVLISLHQNANKFNIKKSIFGFSFQNSRFNKSRFDHYFEIKEESRERAHSIINEVTLLGKLFK